MTTMMRVSPHGQRLGRLEERIPYPPPLDRFKILPGYQGRLADWCLS